jgi:hypothetical protein
LLLYHFLLLKTILNREWGREELRFFSRHGKWNLENNVSVSYYLCNLVWSKVTGPIGSQINYNKSTLNLPISAMHRMNRFENAARFMLTDQGLYSNCFVFFIIY